MARRDPETDPRARLGDELRRARVAAGFSSQEALAAKLGFDRTVIAKAETGDRPPTSDVLAAWCQVCHLDPALFERWAVLARRTDGSVPTWFEDWLEAERAAQSLRIWSPILIPGLLQTAEYARALFLGEQTDTSDDAIDPLVAARLERQAILDQADPPETLRMEGIEDRTDEKRSLVRKAAVAFDRVRGDALSRSASRELIRKVAEEWKR